MNRAEETEAGYDAVAEDYMARATARSGEVDAFTERFVALLSPGSLVVDLGGGSGADALLFTKAGHFGIALDRSSRLLQLGDAPARLRADMGAIPIADNAADALWSHASLLHIESDEVDALFNEWGRILRPGGLIAIATSLGGDSGWELAPAAPDRVPNMADGRRRWFVHHEEMTLRQQFARRQWSIVESSVRSSHRDWLLAIVRVPEA